MTQVQTKRYFDSMLPLLGLNLEQKYHADALQYFALIAQLAAELDTFVLSREVAPAPIFRP